MASGQTTNFGLNQWAAEDKVLREDFNADNQKIDAAIAQKASILMGTYTGDGATYQDVVLSQKPKLIMVWEAGRAVLFGSTYTYCGLATPEYTCKLSNSTILKVTEQGFRAYYSLTPSTAQAILNNVNVIYFYLAVV